MIIIDFLREEYVPVKLSVIGAKKKYTNSSLKQNKKDRIIRIKFKLTWGESFVYGNGPQQWQRLHRDSLWLEY